MVLKTLYSVREVISDNYKVLVLNALVISHLLYSAVLLNGINNNLIRSLEKQLSWVLRACFQRKKYDSSLDLKIKNKIPTDQTFYRSKITFPYFENSFEETSSSSNDRISYAKINKTQTVQKNFLHNQNSIQLFRKLRIQSRYNKL